MKHSILKAATKVILGIVAMIASKSHADYIYKLQEEKTVYLNIKTFPLDDSIIHCVFLNPGVLNTYKLFIFKYFEKYKLT